MRTDRTTLGLVVVAVVASAGCVVPRELAAPTTFSHEDRGYVYFVEQEQMKSSRIKKCDIAADNGVTCKTQFDLE